MNERLISPEEWEGLNELFQECLRLDFPVRFYFEAGRKTRSSGEIQGPQGFLLEINYYSFSDGGAQRLYRSVNEMVADGWKILGIIATERHIEDVLI